MASTGNNETKSNETNSIMIGNFAAGMSATDYGMNGIRQLIGCDPSPTGKYLEITRGTSDDRTYTGYGRIAGIEFDDTATNYYALFENRYLARYKSPSDYDISLVSGATADFVNSIRFGDDIFVLQSGLISVFRGVRSPSDSDVEWTNSGYTDSLITFTGDYDINKKSFFMNKDNQLYLFNNHLGYIFAPYELESGGTSIESKIKFSEEIRAVALVSGLFYIFGRTQLAIWDGFPGGSLTIVDWSNINVYDAIAMNDICYVVGRVGNKDAIIIAQGTQKSILYEFTIQDQECVYGFRNYIGSWYEQKKRMAVSGNNVYVMHEHGILKIKLEGNGYKLTERQKNQSSSAYRGAIYAYRDVVVWHDSQPDSGGSGYTIKKIDLSTGLYQSDYPARLITEKLDGGLAGVEKNLIDVSVWYGFRNYGNQSVTGYFVIEYKVDEDINRTSVATINYNSSSRQKWYSITLNKSFYEIQFRVSIYRGASTTPSKEPILYAIGCNYETTNGLAI